MQPYRFQTSKTAPNPSAPGAALCQHDDCEEIAESQHQRHATEAEYAALPEGLIPSDGICHMAVFTCGDHELGPVCGPEHHVPPEPADPLATTCPKCSAGAGASCVKADGEPRRTVHRQRAPIPAPHDAMVGRCDHVHRADCEGLGACRCSADDPIPHRPQRSPEGAFAESAP